jgi:hypothetical protein
VLVLDRRRVRHFGRPGGVLNGFGRREVSWIKFAESTEGQDLQVSDRSGGGFMIARCRGRAGCKILPVQL